MTQQEREPAADKQPRLPVGMVEIGPENAVWARKVCGVQYDHSEGRSVIYFDYPGQVDFADSPLPYAEVMRRLRQAQLDELAEPGDPEVVHLLREALDCLPEPQRGTLAEGVTRLVRALYMPSALAEALNSPANRA